MATTDEYSALRRTVARASKPALVWLDRRPRWLLTAVVTALLVAGLWLDRPLGPIFLGMVTFLLVWLSYLAWPSGGTGRKVMRLVMVAFALGALILRLFT